MLPDVQIRHSAFGVGYPQVNSLVDFDENGGFTSNSEHYLVSEPFLNNEVEYHEKGHCLWSHTSYYRGEIEALVNFVHAYVSRHSEITYLFSCYHQLIQKLLLIIGDVKCRWTRL